MAEDLEDWIAPPETDESERDDAPVLLSDELDEAGYDPADDPVSDPIESAPPVAPDRGGWVLPVAPAAIPGWVGAYANGYIPLDKMLKVAPIGAGYLIPEAAAAWRMFQGEARAAGFNLTMTGAYRTYDQQVYLFQQNFATTDTGGKKKNWNGVDHWLKKGFNMAAKPGTSNHGWGAAVDMALDTYTPSPREVGKDAAFMNWAVANAARCGWSWEVQSEAWHVRLISAARPAPATPGVTGAIEPPLPELKLGTKGGQVAALQAICVANGWGDCGNPDGTFGPRTEAAVKILQTAVGATPDGVYGPTSARRLGEFLRSR